MLYASVYTCVPGTMGVVTARWCQIRQVGIEVPTTLGAVMLRIGDHEITWTPQSEGCPGRAASYGTACLDKPRAHNADTRFVCRCDYREQSLAGAGWQSRSSLRWDRVET